MLRLVPVYWPALSPLAVSRGKQEAVPLWRRLLITAGKARTHSLHTELSLLFFD